MAGADDKLRVEGGPIKDGLIEDQTYDMPADPSASQSAYFGLMMLVQAVKLMPQTFKYVSFALSLIFLVLWLNPLGSLLSQLVSPANKSSSSSPAPAVSQSRRQHSHSQHQSVAK